MTTDLERAARALIYAWDNADEHNDPDSALEVLRAALPAEGATGALRSLLEKAHDAGRERERGRDDADNHGIPPESRRRMDVDRILAEAAPGRVYDATKAHPAPADAGVVEALRAWQEWSMKWPPQECPDGSGYYSECDHDHAACRSQGYAALRAARRV